MWRDPLGRSQLGVSRGFGWLNGPLNKLSPRKSLPSFESEHIRGTSEIARDIERSEGQKRWYISSLLRHTHSASQPLPSAAERSLDLRLPERIRLFISWTLDARHDVAGVENLGILTQCFPSLADPYTNQPLEAS